MGTITSRNIHLFSSLIFFAACLALPAYYLGEQHQPQMSYQALILGWLGPLGGQLSWFANVFFLIALLKYRKPKTSSILGFTSLAFALSFLADGRDAVSKISWDISEDVTAYGAGYMLWIVSIGTFSLGQYLLTTNKSEKFTHALLSGWGASVLILFSYHYFIGDGSHYSLEVERNSIFERKCRISGQTVYEKATNVKGVFFDPNLAPLFRKKVNYEFDWKNDIKTVTGDWYQNGDYVLLRNSENLQFYEIRSHQSNLDNLSKYIRYEKGNNEGSEVSQLNSEYAVITRNFDIQNKYAISGAEIVIKDLRNGKILATTSYVFDDFDNRFCGHAPNDRFLASEFVSDILNIAKVN